MSGDSRPIHLHSEYNPSREAARFVEAQDFPFAPAIVVVTEPGESYLAGEFRSRFPLARLIAIRYQESLFRDTDRLWDAVWRPSSGMPVESFLFGLIPDEVLPMTVFLSWKPSDSIWPESANAVWSGIAATLRMQRSVMGTRSHFGKRWFANMVRNAALLERPIEPIQTRRPVLLAAAGPSLESQYPIPENRFFVMAVSASMASLLHHGAMPDMCVATDGGYWAKEHLRGIPENIPVAFPLEAMVPVEVLERNPVVLLDYGSELERALLSFVGVESMRAKRNGTVSGTAAELALSITDKNVYAAGLDLMCGPAYSHARPYSSDIRTDVGSSRVNPLSGALYERNRDDQSLSLYASWFSSRDAFFRERFMRLEPEGRKLGGIRTVSISEAVRDCEVCASATEKRVLEESRPKTTRREEIVTWLRDCEDVLVRNSGSLSFFALMDENPLMNELLQTVAYGQYLKCVKANRSVGSREEKLTATAAACDDAVSALRKNIARLVSP
ncbi:MAG TPA: DUF115 domain-containing protein [Treponemataceae bacterium]|nr:DUF115 domain-containing protein [Treponemataceae bacterium]